MPEEDLGFEVAVAAAVHDAFLQLAADNGTNHIGIGFPLRIHIAEFQTKQAVHAVEVGFLADEFDSDLRRFGFAFEQQGFLVNDVDQVKIGEGLHIADEAVEAFFLFALRGIGFIEFLADHAQIGVVLLLDGGIRFHGGREVALTVFDVAENDVGARTFFVGFECFADVVAGGVEVGFKQRGLGDFAIELGDFKLVGLFVMAQELCHFDGFFPVAVLLVDAQKVLAGFACHIAFLQT